MSLRTLALVSLHSLVLTMCFQPIALHADEFPKVFNTEAEGQAPPSAQEMLTKIELPEGFVATLFASEPAVQQPICMDFDDRGRLWVVENYTYSGGPYETKLRDRVIILEDVDGDGQHDKRTVFWDKGFMTTSLTWGFGGLWILHDGTLSFIPDRNMDDRPDSEPVVMLDGWSKECGHNFVSGLTWGPDGWLYGRHGIVDTSYPGVPGTPREARPAMNCGVWRYHPIKHTVEVVCNGTTNPWGLDYNVDGQFFMTNNVQGHLWHVIPGAHFQRMYGQDFNPHAYELMDMTADHYHWDTKTKWNESRDGKANDFGGGHSHVGGMIYHADNFPERYRNMIFMCNTHGRRINVNRLDLQGSGYVGKREPDFMLVKNPWFRGVDLKLGPEGAMYVADWSDNGECHDHDGIHRTSGRIYRISYGMPAKTTNFEEKLNNTPLQKFDWWGRHARRRLQEKLTDANQPINVAGLDDRGLSGLLLRETLGRNTESTIRAALTIDEPRARAYAVHLASANGRKQKIFAKDLSQLASQPQPANVLLALVGALPRFAMDQRAELCAAMLKCNENAQTIASENQLTLMTWYALEPVSMRPGFLALTTGNPKLAQFTVRRRAHEIDNLPESIAETLAHIDQVAASATPSSKQTAASLLTAFKSGLAGRVKVKQPETWKAVEASLRKSNDQQITSAVDALAVLFGDGAALDELRKLVTNNGADAIQREQAMRALAQSKDAAIVPALFNLINDRAVADVAIEALRSFDHPDTATQLINRFGGLKDGNKARAIDTLSSRLAYALKLAQALESGKIDASELSASQVRQLRAFGNKDIDACLESKWGIIQETPEARLAAIEKWKQALTKDAIAKADKAAGAALFKKSCANCHKLYGEGGAIGPDLTGANRSNLEYLLINIIDPSAVVPKQFTTSVISLKEGRLVAGVVVAQTETSVVVQTEKEQLTFAKDDIDQIKNTGKSLMPDGTLDTLSEEQVRELFRFLMP